MDRKMTELDFEAAKNLKRIWTEKRKELGFTQEQAAEFMGVTQSTVSQYLRGVAALGLEATLRFAYFLGVDPRDIRPDLPEWVVTSKSLKLDVSADLLSLVREISCLSSNDKQVVRRIVSSLVHSNEMR
jgi:transcriptional regulator with XRE-family HTH domain